jgi:hypothetical protein
MPTERRRVGGGHEFAVAGGGTAQSDGDGVREETVRYMA